MNNYTTLLGFTIGPIYELMSHSKKTRELWFSSFFFSWYVKMLYGELSKTPSIEPLSPFFNPTKPPANTKAGLFPDHIIAQSKDEVYKTYNILKVFKIFLV